MPRRPLSFALPAILLSASGWACAQGAVSGPADDGFWCSAPSATLARHPPSWAAAVAAAGIKTVRNFDAARPDVSLAPLEQADLRVSGILWWSPPGSPGTLPISDLAGWKSYVQTTVARYRGRVQQWEVWNEPPNFTKDHSPASYGAVVAAAYESAKEIDPSVRIGLAAKSNHVNYLAQAIDAGAAGHFDFVSLHPYENAALLNQGFEAQFMSIVPRVRRMLVAHDAPRAQVPVWFSEIGVPVATPQSKGVPPAEQADDLVKIYTLAAAQGVARTCWFSPRDAEGEFMGLMAGDGSARPSFTALKVLANHLGPHPRALGWMQDGEAWHGFLFAGPKARVLAAWASPGSSARLSMASTVDAVDPSTGKSQAGTVVTLTERPVLLVANAGSPSARAWERASSAKPGSPLAWFGQHTGASEVSLSAETGPNGVVMIDAPAPVRFGGRMEYDLEGRPATYFTVDPAFDSFEKATLKVTIRLRGHGQGDPGFNLKYESGAPLQQADDSGLVNAPGGWHSVSGTQVYEKSWTLPDTRFVGFYGYNFVLATDGPKHSQFSLLDLQVSRETGPGMGALDKN